MAMLLIAAVLILVSGASVVALSADPFHWTFDAGLGALAAGFAATVALGLRRLTRSRRRLVRGIGVGAWLAAGAVAAGAIVLAADYRLLVFRPASAAAWKADLDLLSAALDRLPVRLRAHAQIQTKPLLEKFIANLDGMDEDTRHARLAMVIASLEDGHSLYLPFFPASSIGLVPLQARFFDEGLYIVAAGGRHAGLTGQRILRVNGLPVEEAYLRMAPLVAADNDVSRRHRAPAFMLSPRLWHALGTGSRDVLTLDVESFDGSARTIDLTAANRAKYLWWYARPWIFDRDPWTVRLSSDRSAVIVNLKRIDGETRDALGRLAVDVLAQARDAGARKIIFDVRENGGGDNTLLPPLVGALAGSEYNQPDRLYVLTGPGTFSAATNFVSLMERKTRATLVGRPTGSGPNHHGDSDHVVLPATRVVLFLSTRWHQFGAADDMRRSHTPAVIVPDTAADFFNGHDAVLEAALRR